MGLPQLILSANKRHMKRKGPCTTSVQVASRHHPFDSGRLFIFEWHGGGCSNAFPQPLNMVPQFVIPLVESVDV